MGKQGKTEFQCFECGRTIIKEAENYPETIKTRIMDVLSNPRGGNLPIALDLKICHECGYYNAVVAALTLDHLFLLWTNAKKGEEMIREIEVEVNKIFAQAYKESKKGSEVLEEVLQFISTFFTNNKGVKWMDSNRKGWFETYY